MASNSQFPSLKADKFKTANVPRKMRPSEIYSSPRLTAPIRCACQPGSLLKNQDKAAARPHCTPNGWQREKKGRREVAMCGFFPSDRLLSSCPLLQPPPQSYSMSRSKQPSWNKVFLSCCKKRFAKCCRSHQVPTGVGVRGMCGWHHLAGFIIWGRTVPWDEEALGRDKEQPQPSMEGWKAGAGGGGMVGSRLLDRLE